MGPTADAQPDDLGTFDGRDIAAVAIIVTNAGDGLSDAMEVDPQILHLGDRGTIALDYEVAKIRFDPVKDVSDLRRVQILKATRATLIDSAAVRDALDAQEKRIAEVRAAAEQPEGAQVLPFEDGRGGEPTPVGDALDKVLAIADEAEAEGGDGQ